MLTWTAGVFAEVRADYTNFRVARFDLGNMVQAVWSTANGRPLDVTLATGEQSSRLASHVDPILVLLAPAWLVWPSPLLLALVQVAACSLGALPVYWLARKYLCSDVTAALLALAYLAYPWLAWTALDAFHPVTLAIPLFLYAIWFLHERRLYAFSICALLVLMTGELMGVVVAGLGFWYWLAHRGGRPGLAIGLAGLVWSFVALKVVIPYFHGSESVYYEHYRNVGGSPRGVITTLFTDPGAIAATTVFSQRDVTYVLLLGLPLGGLFLLAPSLASLAIPQLFANALNDSALTWDPRHHYIAAVVPFLIVATVIGVSRLPRRLWNVAVGSMIVVSLFVSTAVAPWPSAPWVPERLSRAAKRDLTYGYLKKRLPDERVDALRAAVALVPAGVAVAATNKAASHLSARRVIYSLPVTRDAEWIVLDRRDPWVARSGTRPAGLAPAVLDSAEKKILSDPAWQEVFERHGVVVFRKEGKALSR